MKQKQHSKGYSLLEVVFASAIMAFSASLLVSVGSNLREFSRNEQKQNEIEREATLAMDYLSRDIKTAVAVAPDLTEDFYHPSVLVLKTPEYDATGTPVTGSFDYISYSMVPENGMLVRTVYDDVDAAVVSNEISIPVGSCAINCMVDGQFWPSLMAETAAQSIEISVTRGASGSAYYRTLSISATLRNPSA